MNTVSSVYAAGGVFTGIMIIVALLKRDNADRYANRFLAASLACSICYLLAIILMHIDGFNYPSVIVLIVMLSIFSLPFLFLYVKVLTTPCFDLSIKDLVCFIPILFYLLLNLIIFDYPLNFMNQASFDEARSGWPPSKISLLSVVHYSISGIYLMTALMRIRAHRTSILNKHSYEYKVTLGWLLRLITLYALLVAFGLIIATLRWLPGVELWPRSFYSMTMIIFIYYLIAFMGISQPRIFSARSNEPVEQFEGSVQNKSQATEQFITASKSNKKKYKTSTLTIHAEEGHWSDLQALMIEKKPYLKNDLRIVELANLAGIPTSHLSQTINHYAGRNFFDFVNGYRVDEAKQLIKQQQWSITQIALESGFNSQSVFFKQFKRLTGMTPKQFQRQFSQV